jgi:hypothetical protein
MKAVVVVTTKPALNEAEYAIVEDGQILRHGERIDIDIAALPPADQQKLADARGVLLGLAQADAAARGLI